MNDADVNKLLMKLTKSLATKDDLKQLATKDDFRELKGEIDEVKEVVKKVHKDLSKRISVVDEKADGILELVENINEDHEKRLKRLEKQAPATA